jgi:hypothetical protein
MTRPGCGVGLTVLVVLAIALTLLALAGAALAAGENTPPTVGIDKPTAGTALGVTAQVNGVARDAEGFNMSSFVQLRWDDLAWFLVLSTPGDNGSTLSYGTFVDMSPFTPGEHLLSARAYDGELWSEEANITVVVRDLPDLVVFPTDVTLDPPDAGPDERADLVVVVHNDGGEDATGVVVRAVWEGTALGEATIGLVPARGTATARIRVALAAGESNVTVHVELPTPQQERSTSNNDATAAFDIEGPCNCMWWKLLFIAIGAIATASILVGLYVRARSAHAGGPPRNH